jgi:hypothetical protein
MVPIKLMKGKILDSDMGGETHTFSQGSYREPLLGRKQKYYWVMENQCPNL